MNRLAFIEDGLGHNVQRQAGVRHGSASSRHPGDQLMDIPMQAVRNSEPNARLRRHIGRVKTGSTHAGVARIHVCSTEKGGSGTSLSSAHRSPLVRFSNPEPTVQSSTSNKVGLNAGRFENRTRGDRWQSSRQVPEPPFSVLHTCILAAPSRLLPVFDLVICLPKFAFNSECYTVRIGISTTESSIGLHGAGQGLTPT